MKKKVITGKVIIEKSKGINRPHGLCFLFFSNINAAWLNKIRMRIPDRWCYNENLLYKIP
ncbi:MAG: hypothetical protein PWQ34_296 [Caldanaerobacter sp.]|jgi:hypothetical protein|nr:hypothetical protein [Caldanaerobacter sp.]